MTVFLTADCLGSCSCGDRCDPCYLGHRDPVSGDWTPGRGFHAQEGPEAQVSLREK